jgi:hypothetical protein
MKKLFIVLLAIAMLSAFSACNDGQESPSQANVEENSDDAAGDGVDLNKENIVDITIPAYFFEIEGLMYGDWRGDIAEEAESRGYDSATWNEDGSLTINMSKEKFEKDKVEKKEFLDQVLERIAGYSQYPQHIERIECTADYRKFTVFLDTITSDYSKDFPYCEYIASDIWSYVGRYQAYTGQELSLSIDIVNKYVDVTLLSKVYP